MKALKKMSAPFFHWAEQSDEW